MERVITRTCRNKPEVALVTDFNHEGYSKPWRKPKEIILPLSWQPKYWWLSFLYPSISKIGKFNVRNFPDNSLSKKSKLTFEDLSLNMTHTQLLYFKQNETNQQFGHDALLWIYVSHCWDGLLAWDASKKGTHQVAMTLNVVIFIEIFF